MFDNMIMKMIELKTVEIIKKKKKIKKKKRILLLLFVVGEEEISLIKKEIK